MSGPVEADRQPPAPELAAQARPARGRARALLAGLIRRRESAILLALVVLMVGIGLYESNFLSGSNLYLVSRQISFVAIVALGELFVILHGGIDLSVGSIMALAGMAAAKAMENGHPAASGGADRLRRRPGHGRHQRHPHRLRAHRAVHRDPRDAVVRLRRGARTHKGLADHRHPGVVPAAGPGRLPRPAHPGVDRARHRRAAARGADLHSVRPAHLRHRRQRAGDVPVRHQRQPDQVRPLCHLGAVRVDRRHHPGGALQLGPGRHRQAAGSSTPSRRRSSAARRWREVPAACSACSSAPASWASSRTAWC